MIVHAVLVCHRVINVFQNVLAHDKKTVDAECLHV